MNTPNPLMPQGALQQQARGKSTVRIAVFAICAIHAVIFTGLLWQGCNRDGKKADTTTGATNLANEIPKLPESTYYTNFADVPATTPNLPATNVPPPTEIAQQTNKPAPFTPLPVSEPPAKPAETKDYVVVKGDYPKKIADEHHLTLAELNKANPGLEPTKLKIGQIIHIPPPTPTASASTNNHTESAGADGSKVHVVKAGENLGRIATQYKTTVTALKAANNLKTDRINAGQKLKVPPPKAAATTNSATATGANR